MNDAVSTYQLVYPAELCRWRMALGGTRTVMHAVGREDVERYSTANVARGMSSSF
jgi:hypothetical protein